MAISISTTNGDFVLISAYDAVGNTLYDVHLPSNDEIYGEFVGEYRPAYHIYDDYDNFVNHFERWLNDKDIVNLDISFEDNDNEVNKVKQNLIKAHLNKLVFKRFSKESLEKKLSAIFGEKIEIELICEDVDYLTDWNFAFSSEQDVIGGDFDIYVLFHKDNRKGHDGAGFIVTEVNWEFFDRY